MGNGGLLGRPLIALVMDPPMHPGSILAGAQDPVRARWLALRFKRFCVAFFRPGPSPLPALQPPVPSPWRLRPDPLKIGGRRWFTLGTPGRALAMPSSGHGVERLQRLCR